MVSLARSFGNSCLALSELNIHPSLVGTGVEDIWQPYHSMWVMRRSLLDRLGPELPLVLLDRSHFSTLAVEWAKERAGMKGEFVAAARAADICRLDRYDAILVFRVRAHVGLERRRSSHEVFGFWSNPTFLEALDEFYERRLPCLCKGRIISVDATSQGTRELYRELLGIVSSFGVEPNTSRQEISAMAVAELERAGAQWHLGSSYGPPFPVLGYPTMYFRQHSLQLTDRGVQYFDNDRLKELAQEGLLG